MGPRDRQAPRGALLAGAGLLPLTLAVLRRMERDHDQAHALRPGTVALMYGTYAAYLTTLAHAARRQVLPLPLPRRPAAVAGGVALAAGTGLAAAGMGSFDSPAQLSGTDAGTLHRDGIYRWSRNPQYAGTVVALAGASLARRSGLAAMLTVGAWATYRRWISSEEALLRRTFGPTYDSYAAAVPRWIGRPRSS